MGKHKLRVHLRCDGNHAFCGAVAKRPDVEPLILTTAQDAVTCKRCSRLWWLVQQEQQKRHSVVRPRDLILDETHPWPAPDVMEKLARS